ncbi:MAG: putative glycosyltransferase (TIGR04348 family) [Planctomycetota bacterium]
MRILIVTPAAKGTRLGNRVTALRVAGLLRYLGHKVRVRSNWEADGSDVLFALHARKSAEALNQSRGSATTQKRVLILTGTDVYGDLEKDTVAQESLRIADRVVVLQPRALQCLPTTVQSKSRVIRQSARGIAGTPDPLHFDICVLAHLRPVKDPLLTARAARLLPQSSRIRVRNVGSALDNASREEAENEQAQNPRFEWLGELRHPETLGVLSKSQLMVVTSHSEGGPAVVTEAIACGIPVLSTRIPAAEGLLGDDHPGLFPVGDEKALAVLLERCESDPSFIAELRERSVKLLPTVDPCREAQDLKQLLAEL